MNEEEVWKDIIGYEGYYQVSNHGSVRSLTRTNFRKHKYGVTPFIIQGRILKGIRNPHGYLMVKLCKNGECLSVFIHVIVARHFIGEKPKGQQVCHGDGVSDNNNISNLRYDTPKNNSLDRVSHGTDASGENNPRAKYSEDFVKLIKRDTRSTKTISEEYGVCQYWVRSIKSGIRWKHVK